MKQVPLAQIPEMLETAFAAADPANAGKVQERSNVERVAEMIHLIAAGRFDELRELLAPDVTFELAAPARAPWVRRARGVDEVVAAIAKNFGSVRDQLPEPLGLVAQGDTVMVMGRETGRWVDDDEPYEVLLAHQFTFRDGKLAAFHSVSAENREPAGAY
jgi:ketosteroid isomerase-like protein